MFCSFGFHCNTGLKGRQAMTTPTPAETAREQAASPEMIALNFIRRYTQLDAYGPAMKSLQSDIAQAITAAHAQGWDECVEACINAVCEGCRSGLAVIDQTHIKGGDFVHKVKCGMSWHYEVCDAARIRALKGGPK